MKRNPFSLFAPYADRLRVVLFTKEDGTPTSEEIAGKLGTKDIARLWQVHGNRTVVVDAPMDRTEKADGMITDKHGLGLAIDAADCQNFVIYAPERNVVGMLHVGWKGLLAKAITEFYASLKKEWGIEPEETLVGAGPSLCVRCADFTDPRMELPTTDPAFFHNKCADLRGIADAELRSLGVQQIERHPGCTRCDPKNFWTYRGGDREAVLAGERNVLACTLL